MGLPNGELVDSLEAAVEGSDCLLLLTDHRAFLSIDPEHVGKLMRRQLLVDTRNLFDRDRWIKSEFEYHLLGDGRRSEEREAFLMAEPAPQ